jgi:probable addiction module antidote protein
MKHGRKAAPAAVPHEDWLLGQLKDAEFAAEYLNAALIEGDQAAFMLALRDVARARGGMTAVARRTGMNRVALTRALSEKGNPELRSLTKILDASGVRLQFVAQRARRGARRAAGRASRRAA